LGKAAQLGLTTMNNSHRREIGPLTLAVLKMLPHCVTDLSRIFPSTFEKKRTEQFVPWHQSCVFSLCPWRVRVMENEKDRFGETMRLVERAKEDIYFAERNRELLEARKLHV
jgi:hypothetical protein